MKRLDFYLLIILLIGGVGCKDDDASNPIGEVLVSSELLDNVTKSKILSENPGFESFESQMLESVEVYRLVYKTTDVNNEEVQASGALIIPSTSDELPILSYQHDTFILSSSAPSVFSQSNSQNKLWVGLLLSSVGYIVSAPDYLGYGSTNDLVHPYHHASSLASASLDMLNAAKEFLMIQGINSSDQLFLAGFSEGGYATAALQREIEENEPDLSIAASSPGSGAYNLSQLGSQILMQESYPIAAFLGFLFLAYDQTYDLETTMSDYFREPYASTIEGGLFNGSIPEILVEASLTTSIENLFQPSFLTNYLDENTDVPIRTRFEENDLLDWAPQSPTTIFHGELDMIVDVSAAEVALASYENNGSTSTELVIFPGLGHSDAWNPYFEATIEWFETIKD